MAVTHGLAMMPHLWPFADRYEHPCGTSLSLLFPSSGSAVALCLPCSCLPNTCSRAESDLACQAAGVPPPKLIVSGGVPVLHGKAQGCEAVWMAEFLESAGVPCRDIWRETQARSTFANLVQGGALAWRHGITSRQLALVSDNFHLPRCYWLFAQIFGHAPTACFGTGSQGSYWLRVREKLALASHHYILAHQGLNTDQSKRYCCKNIISRDNAGY